jgi:hypothetical protein
MGKKIVPFGLLFEESAQSSQVMISPVYDEEKDLSFVQDSSGKFIPYVELRDALGTQTLTESGGESNDEDEENSARLTGTRTETLADGENTDEDDDRRYSYFLSIGTQTATKADGETIDEDPNDGLSTKSLADVFEGY